jgi:hypothetical protein
MADSKFLDDNVLTIRNTKLNEVREFIKLNCNLAPQGSEEWLKTRQSIIGGSELSILINKNPYTTIADLVASKCNLLPFSGNVIATKWGNIFEEVTRNIVQMIYLPDIPLTEECIYETGSLEGVIPHHRFSPDGLTVLVKRMPNGDFVPTIVLLEFKSPLSTIPNKNIPPHYLPQVLAGMCDIDMVEAGLFVNAVFRKCTLDQFGNNSQYNQKFHKSDEKKKIILDDPIAIGIIGFYQTSDQIKKVFDMRKYESEIYIRCDDSSDDEPQQDDSIESKIFNNDNIIDIGELDDTETLFIFENVMKKNISMEYFAPNIYMDRLAPNLPNDIVHYPNDIISYKTYESNPTKFIERFNKLCYKKGVTPLGFLPWKLFMVDFISVDKIPLYIYKFAPLINDVIKIIQEICEVDDLDERMARYKKYYS